MRESGLDGGMGGRLMMLFIYSGTGGGGSGGGTLDAQLVTSGVRV